MKSQRDYPERPYCPGLVRGVSGQDMKQDKQTNARPGEEESYLIIVKIDNDAKVGRIIHIALGGLKIKNPRSPEGISDTVNHLPLAAAAIEKSALKY